MMNESDSSKGKEDVSSAPVSENEQLLGVAGARTVRIPASELAPSPRAQRALDDIRAWEKASAASHFVLGPKPIA